MLAVQDCAVSDPGVSNSSFEASLSGVECYLGCSTCVASANEVVAEGRTKASLQEGKCKIVVLLHQQ